MSSRDDKRDDDSSGHERKAFKFTISAGKVTAAFELDDGVWESKSIDDDGSETYVVEGTEVVRTEVKAFGAEITRYADVDGDGTYLLTCFGAMDGFARCYIDAITAILHYGY